MMMQAPSTKRKQSPTQSNKTEKLIQESNKPERLLINTSAVQSSGLGSQASNENNEEVKLQFRPYDQPQGASSANKSGGHGPFSPKLIPYQKHSSFTSSERSSDLSAKTIEASQGQGHQTSKPPSYASQARMNTAMIHTRVNFSGVIEENGNFLTRSGANRSTIHGTELIPENLLGNSRQSYTSNPRMVSTTEVIEAIAATETRDGNESSYHPYQSFNLTMSEEYSKIRNQTMYLKRASEDRFTSKELIPCDFLRYIANVGDDLEQMAFQLNANHSDNFPVQVTKAQQAATVTESMGQKIFRLFKPNTSNPQVPLIGKDAAPNQGHSGRDQTQLTPSQHRSRHQRNKTLTNMSFAPESQTSTDILSQSMPDSRETLRHNSRIRERNRSVNRHSRSFAEDSLLYTPIYKLNIARAYTQDEWVTILMHSIQKIKAKDRIQANLGLQIEHLSQARIKQSFYAGLESVQCESLRGEIWKLICKVHNSKSQYKRGIIRKFIEQEDERVTHKIIKDLGRTFPGNAEFKLPATSGQNRLFNVLKAFSAYDPETGYCQGMNFISGMLLQMMPDQEDAFWCLVYVMFVRDWRSIFSDDSARINQMIDDLANFLRKNCRSVYQHMQRQQIATMAASFSSQFITLFIYDNDFNAAVKVFELFLVEGEKVLVELLAGMIMHKKATILQLQDLELMTYLRKDMVQECLSAMNIREILMHPSTHKQIQVKLSFNSVQDTIY